MKKFLNFYQASELALLLGIWIVTLAFNLGKAVHIDDSVHLYAARSIVNNPLRPYSGQIHWGWVTPGPLSDIAQPPLLFYCLALFMQLFGENELILHTLPAVFSLALVIVFHRVASLFNRTYAVFATALLALGPAYLPGQNLMTDLPVVFFHILFLYLTIESVKHPNNKSYLIAAGLVVASACLTKYVGLVLIPLFFVASVFGSNRRNAWAFIIPLLALVAWAGFSYLDSGNIHFNQPLVKQMGSRFFNNTTDWLVVLGAISPFSFIFLPHIFRGKVSRWLFLLLFAFLVLYRPDRLTKPIEGHPLIDLTAHIFWANGILVALSSLHILLLALAKPEPDSPEPDSKVRKFGLILCIGWLIGSFLFITIFAKFIAVRHVLLVMPVVILAVAVALEDKPIRIIQTSALALTMLLGTSLALSDYAWANVYRRKAKEFATQYMPEHTVWSVGHWGWQWLSEQNGMKIYDWNSKIQANDIIIAPQNIHRHKIKKEHLKRVELIEEVVIPSTLTTMLRTMVLDKQNSGYYASRGNGLPYRITNRPLETFLIYKVKKD